MAATTSFAGQRFHSHRGQQKANLWGVVEMTIVPLTAEQSFTLRSNVANGILCHPKLGKLKWGHTSVPGRWCAGRKSFALLALPIAGDKQCLVRTRSFEIFQCAAGIMTLD